MSLINYHLAEQTTRLDLQCVLINVIVEQGGVRSPAQGCLGCENRDLVAGKRTQVLVAGIWTSQPAASSLNDHDFRG